MIQDNGLRWSNTFADARRAGVRWLFYAGFVGVWLVSFVVGCALAGQ